MGTVKNYGVATDCTGTGTTEYFKVGQCVKTAAGKFVKIAACDTASPAVHVSAAQFSDATCGTALTGAADAADGVTVSMKHASGTCSDLNGVAAYASACGDMSCAAVTDGKTTDCTAIVAKKAAANNSSTDNTVTASVAGALALSAAAFVFA